MSEDHKSQEIGAYGGRRAKFSPAPSPDKVAREVMCLDGVFCNNSICTPSCASILTG